MKYGEGETIAEPTYYQVRQVVCNLIKYTLFVSHGFSRFIVRGREDFKVEIHCVLISKCWLLEIHESHGIRYACVLISKY